MKILWICNVIPLPQIADAINVPRPVIGGWMTGLAESLAMDGSVDLSIAFPLMSAKNTIRGSVGSIDYYGFPTRRKVPFLNIPDELDTSAALVDTLRAVIDSAQPDLLHIFGTEYGHSLAAARAFDDPSRTLVNIQGLTSVYSQHYLGSLPRSVHRRWLPSNLIRGSLAQQAHRLAVRGNIEIDTLRAAGHVLGRTDWDRACSHRINPDAAYHFCAEALRASFYSGQWDRANCEPFSLFISQGSSPVKGVYYAIEAMPEILRRFPTAHLYIAGNDPTRADSMRTRLSRSAYGAYLAELIAETGVREHVTFLGALGETDMRDRLLRSHVLVSPSTIENESNAVSEARLLGMPSVVSFVGGLTSIVRHRVDAMAYQHDAPYMLAHHVCELFEDDDLAVRIGEAAREAAVPRNDRATIALRQREIYAEVLTG